MNVYLCIGYDRHSDDEYAIFTSLDKAIEQCKEWEKIYQGRYEFKVPTRNWQKYWEYYVDAGDDCPKMAIQKLVLDKFESV